MPTVSISTLTDALQVDSLLSALNSNFSALKTAIEGIEVGDGGGAGTVTPEQIAVIEAAIASLEASVISLQTQIEELPTGGGGTIDPEQLEEINDAIAANSTAITNLTTQVTNLAASGTFSTETLPYNPEVTVDFSGQRDLEFNIVATGAISFVGSNFTSGARRLYYIETSEAPVNLTFPAEWRPMGVRPVQVPANSLAAIWFGCRGSSSGQVVLAYDVEF